MRREKGDRNTLTSFISIFLVVFVALLKIKFKISDLKVLQMNLNSLIFKTYKSYWNHLLTHSPWPTTMNLALQYKSIKVTLNRRKYKFKEPTSIRSNKRIKYWNSSNKMQFWPSKLENLNLNLMKTWSFRENYLCSSSRQRPCRKKYLHEGLKSYRL